MGLVFTGTPFLAFAKGRYTDTEGRPGLTDNAAHALSHAQARYRIERRRLVIQSHQIAAWWKAAWSLRNTAYRDYFITLLLTGLREEEARGWLGQTWTLRPGRSLPTTLRITQATPCRWVRIWLSY
jgi:hypothetical protein